ncbi:MAG TPA: co-chaperone GroES [Gammaproteobacteria bacterium]|nr:co-chaperone GroES [Gammaproteobacteria bacterium]
MNLEALRVAAGFSGSMTQNADNAPRTVRPVKGNVLVKQDPKSEKVGKYGILFAPDGSEEWPSFGTVVAVGPGDVAEGGARIPMAVAPGDRIIFRRKPASALHPDVREFDSDLEGMLMLPESYILAVVEDDGE